MIIGRWPSDSIVKKMLLLTKTIKPSSGTGIHIVILLVIQINFANISIVFF